MGGDSDDKEAEKAVANVLTAEAALGHCPKPHRFVAQGAGYTSMEDLSGALGGVDYFDVRGSALTSVDGLAGLLRLKTVLLQGNALRSLRGLGALANIRVLNVSATGLRSLDVLAESAFAPELVALVASRNKLQGIAEVTAFAKLATLVVSRNAIADLAPAAALPALVKLSASHNRVTQVPPAFAHLDALEELRLTHNALTALPDADVMEQWTRLRILDVGHNEIKDITPLGALGPSLVTANFRGNPVAQDLEGYKAEIVGLCPKIEIIDGVRIQGGRKKVREAREMRLRSGGAGEKKMKSEEDEKEDKAKMKSKGRSEREGRSGVPLLVGSEKVRSDGGDGRESLTKQKEKKKKAKEIGVGVLPVSSGPTGVDDVDPKPAVSCTTPTERKKEKEKQKIGKTEDVKSHSSLADAPGENVESKKKKRKKRKVAVEPVIAGSVPSVEGRDTEAAGVSTKRAKTKGGKGKPAVDKVVKFEEVEKAGYGENEDEGLDAEDFINRAKAKKAKAEKDKMRQTFNRSRVTARADQESFGGGGESQWG